MRKIMYLCPVDWQWIKQRPQFLAEELSSYYDVHAVYPYSNKRKGLQKSRNTSVPLIPFYSLPTLGGKLQLCIKINAYLSKLQMRIIYNKLQPDVIWLTMPWQIDFFPKKLSCKLVYDCMDDYSAITLDRKCVDDLTIKEAELLSKASLIFASSGNLKSLLVKRYKLSEEKISLLRNGYSGKWHTESVPKRIHSNMSNDTFKIGYFGTVGRWFDFQLLIDSLSINQQVEYHVWGPLESGITFPKHDRLFYRGVLEHHHIQQYASEMDALVMPFIVNEIVLSVDPVKLYEYISMGKNILCIQYPEVKRFEPFVFFYNTADEYIEQLNAVMQSRDTKYSHQDAVNFLSDNSWETRARQVLYLINAMFENRE